jgi:hypothetical protein
MALWTKQNLLPLPILLLIYVLLLKKGVAISLRYLAYLAVVGTVISLPLIGYFGWDSIHFSMFEFPSAHPSWAQEQTTFFNSILLGILNDILVEETFGLLTQSLPFLSLFFLLLFLSTGWSLKSEKTLVKSEFSFQLQSILVRHPELLLIIVSIGMAPIAILSKIKWGGDINSFSVCIYFLAVACFTVFADCLATLFFDNPDGSSILKRPKVKNFLILGLLFLLSSSLILFNPVSLYRKGAASWYQYNLHPADIEVAFSTLRDLGDEVYFPDFPLASLLAQGKLFHSMKGIYDRKIGQFELTHEHLKAYLPDGFQFVAFGSQPLIEKSTFQQNRVKEFIRVLEASGIHLESVKTDGVLQNWLMYRRTS